MKSTHITPALIGATAMTLLAGNASGQVVINEVYENPPGTTTLNDAVLEYIELYGRPGMDLTGYAVALFKGGADLDHDGLPDNPLTVEIDEAFSLDGLSLGSDGFLVLYNGTPVTSLVPPLLPANVTSASFFDAHIPNPAPNSGVGTLSNGDSSTFILMRRRPGHSIVNGESVYGPGYSMWNDSVIDVDFNSRVDYGIEVPVGLAPLPLTIDPIQMIDDIGWSDNNGKEYARSQQSEFSSTAGFNPDALSRVAYYMSNPMLGQRINSNGNTVSTRICDESWIYGDIAGLSIDLTYDTLHYGAPTDQNGDGFADIAINSGLDTFKLTPGTFNDHAGTGISQFRFITGDLNFDGVVDDADLAFFDASLLGADFESTEDYLDPNTDMPIPDPNNPGQNFQKYIYQGPLANAYLSAANLSDLDGTEVPGMDDRDVLVGLVGIACPADLSGDGLLNFFDISAFLTAFSAQDPIADFTNDGFFNFFDVSTFLQAFSDGCP